MSSSVTKTIHFMYRNKNRLRFAPPKRLCFHLNPYPFVGWSVSNITEKQRMDYGETWYGKCGQGRTLVRLHPDQGTDPFSGINF